MDPIFSGNGVLARSVVRGLAEQYTVAVACAAPLPNHPPGIAVLANVRELVVPVPADKWRRLDVGSAWEEFAAGTARLVTTVAEFSPSLILAVDWTGYAAVRALQDSTAGQGLRHVPVVFLAFRVFSRSDEFVQNPVHRRFYEEHEQAAARAASLLIALCRQDAHALEQFACTQPEASALAVTVPPTISAVIFPPLRVDMHRLALLSAPVPGREAAPTLRRRYLTCSVRLSPEKNAMFFVDIVERMQAELGRLGVVPLLVGAAADLEYAQAVRTRLRAVCPTAVIVEDFLGPDKLGAIYIETLVNVHTALHDAYGMTVVEAAAFGAVTLLDTAGRVGVTDFFTPNEYLTSPFADLTATCALLTHVLTRAEDPAAPLRVCREPARARALTWTEAHVQAQLCDLLRLVRVP